MHRSLCIKTCVLSSSHRIFTATHLPSRSWGFHPDRITPHTRRTRGRQAYWSRRLHCISDQSPAVAALSSRSCYTAPIGLRLWRIGGDGRCMFRALVQGAHQLDKGRLHPCLNCFGTLPFVLVGRSLVRGCPSGYPGQPVGTGEALKLAQEQQAADDLRKRVCEKMRSKQDEISPFLEVDFEQYIEGMSQPSTWGGEPELSVVPDCLKRPVEIYMNGATGLQVMSTYNCTAETLKDPVKVLFNGIGHYDLLVSNAQVSKL